jgi:poly-beta-1,6-N-acetyl-D-glucosamine synthase
MTYVFWASALLIGYVYIGYPALLSVWVRTRGRSAKAASAPSALRRAERTDGSLERLAVHDLPAVSIIVAARNEGRRLSARVKNLLALDYPVDRRQIIIVSDGSTDDTLRVLGRFRGRIDVVSIRPSGKAAALNAGVAHATHGILVFTDARQSFACDALRALVAPFADPGIGGVSGELVLDSEARRPGDPPVSVGIGVYWRFEKWLRRHESAIGSLIGATGAIYALRRSLWRPLPPETILDDVLAPMQAVLAGRRVVFTDRAKAFDRTVASSRAESRRKVRTLAGNVQLLWLEPRLLVPFLNPIWLQFCSHKLGRLAVPYALLALMTSSIALADRHAVYAIALTIQCLFYLLAGYGACLEWRSATSAAALTRGHVSGRTGGDLSSTIAEPSWAAEPPRKGVVNA